MDNSFFSQHDSSQHGSQSPFFLHSKEQTKRLELHQLVEQSAREYTKELELQIAQLEQQTEKAQQKIVQVQEEAEQTVQHAEPNPLEIMERYESDSFTDFYKVRCRDTGCFFAMKQLGPEWQMEPERRQFLQTEANLLQQITSNHLVQFQRSDLQTATPYILLEWLDGQTLEQKLSVLNHEPLQVSTAIWIARQAAEGLRDLEEAGFSHGDLRPDHLFIQRNGSVKLIDFSMSHRLNEPAQFADQKIMVNTAEYLAPEKFTDEITSSVASEIYNLGIILFRMLTGKPPFTGSNAADILRLQRQAKPPSITQLCPTAPKELTHLIESMLAKQPLRRPHNFAQLVCELIRIELTVLQQAPATLQRIAS